MEDSETLVCSSKNGHAKYFFGTSRKFGHAPSECFASPDLGTHSGHITGMHGICGGHCDTGTGYGKVKVEFTLLQATKPQRGSRCTTLLLPQPRR